jgi:hypothetical protein
MSQPNGIYKNLPSEQYFAADRINNSALKLINKPPLHYKQSQALPKEETTAMVMSSAVHTAVLEPSTLLEHYCVAPKCDKRTKEGKQAWSDQEATGKIILTSDDFQMIDTMNQTVHTNEMAAKLLCHSQLVFVSGELSQSEYKANDGATKTSLELNATIVDLIGKKSEGEANT